MELCPCGSEQAYGQCCDPFISGNQPAPTAEALMRSRYSAYVKNEIDYILDTTHTRHRSDFNREDTEAWSRRADWLSLEIIRTENGGAVDEQGIVEFVARYRDKGRMCQHHEVAEFKKEGQRWFFVDGRAPEPAQTVRKGAKIGRNQPCPCGSGKKYKKCCGP